MKTIITVISVAAVLLLSGCNTVKGVGQDIQKAGEKLEGAASKK
jgi:predicted small secreted protein